MGKPLSLADRIAQAKKGNENKEDRNQEKKLIDSLGSSQGQVDLTHTGPILDPNLTQTGPSVDTVSPLGQVKVKSGSGQGQVSSIGSRSSQGQVSTQDSEPIILAQQQQRVYEWFLRTGFEGLFNKGIISRETGINPPTVRKSISKLVKLSLIQISKYDPVSRRQEYLLDTTKKVKLLPGSGQGQVSTQGQVSGQGQVNLGSSSYKKERKIINISFFLENSEFWKKHELTIRKCEEWMNEFENCTPEYLLQQLQFAEETSYVQKADNPKNYFYTTIAGKGFDKPVGFEFPEERRARIHQEEIKRREDLLRLQEENQKKEQELADRESFLLFLDDKQAVVSALKEIEKQATMSFKMEAAIKNYHANGRIDSRLQGSLKRIFFSES